MSIRCGFIWQTSPRDRGALSGMPWRMADSLSRVGVRLHPIRVESTAERTRRTARSVVAHLPPSMEHTLRRGIRRVVARRADNSIRCAARRARRIESQLARCELDVLFGCCTSVSMFDLRTTVPIVYFSDATARIINDTYPVYAHRGESYRAACDRLEQGALRRVSHAAFASDVARRSAIDDYELDAARAHVVPMGANVVPDRPVTTPREVNGSLELCIVASDPNRKRLDLAIDATELLAASGRRVRLTYVGPTHARAQRSPHVVCAGGLQQADRRGRNQLQRVYDSAHVNLLPSVGEAFGITPCEAAHFGVPSVVSAAGGLTTVVRHGVTGIVLPVDAGAAAHADAISRLVDDRDRYRAMSDAARAQAQSRFTWSRWGRRVADLLERAASESTARPSA